MMRQDFFDVFPDDGSQVGELYVIESIMEGDLVKRVEMRVIRKEHVSDTCIRVWYEYDEDLTVIAPIPEDWEKKILDKIAAQRKALGHMDV